MHIKKTAGKAYLVGTVDEVKAFLAKNQKFAQLDATMPPSSSPATPPAAPVSPMGDLGSAGPAMPDGLDGGVDDLGGSGVSDGKAQFADQVAKLYHEQFGKPLPADVRAQLQSAEETSPTPGTPAPLDPAANGGELPEDPASPLGSDSVDPLGAPPAADPLGASAPSVSDPMAEPLPEPPAPGPHNNFGLEGIQEPVEDTQEHPEDFDLNNQAAQSFALSRGKLNKVASANDYTDRLAALLNKTKK